MSDPLWKLVAQFDAAMQKNIRDIVRRHKRFGIARYSDVAPVVCSRESGKEECYVYQTNTSAVEKSNWGKTKKENMPVLWRESAGHFKSIVDSLFDDTDERESLAYFAILLKLDPSIVSNPQSTFTFAAFDKNPNRTARSGLMDYAFGNEALPNTELLFAKGQREPLAYWFSAEEKQSSDLKDEFSNAIGGKHFSVFLTGNNKVKQFWLTDSDYHTWNQLVGKSSKSKTFVDTNAAGRARNKTFAAYFRHILGVDNEIQLEMAKTSGWFGALLIPVTDLAGRGFGAIFLLFGGKKYSTSQEYRKRVNARKAVGASFIIRGAFDSWQKEIKEAEALERTTEMNLVDMFGHEIKGLADAIGDRWSIPLPDWFEQHSQDDFATSKARVIEHPQLFQYAQRILRLWSMSCKADDIPRPKGGTLAGLIRLAFVRAIESRIVANTIELRDTMEIKKILEVPMMKHVESLTQDPSFERLIIRYESLTNDYKVFVRQYFGLFRLFVSLFEDFVKFHGKTDVKCKVALRLTKHKLYIQILSPKAPPAETCQSAVFNFGISGRELAIRLVNRFLNSEQRSKDESKNQLSLNATFTAEETGHDFITSIVMRIPPWLRN
jgi:hypothetical protein